MKKSNLIVYVPGVVFALTCLLLYERDQAMESEEGISSIPVPRAEKKEHVTDSAEITNQQVLEESAPIDPPPARHATREGSQNMLPPISYSLLPQEHNQNVAMLPGTTSLSIPLSIDLSSLNDEFVSERECHNHNSIVSKPCTPSLAIEPKSTMLLSIDTEKNSSAYQIDCGSLLENINRHDDSTGLKEQCLGGLNISGENWNLELWGAMTYRIDPNQESFEIIPCPEGELTECTTLGVGLKVGIP